MAIVTPLQNVLNPCQRSLKTCRENRIVALALQALKFLVSMVQEVVQFVILPFRYGLALLRRCCLLRYMLYPFDWTIAKVIALWDHLYYRVEEALCGTSLPSKEVKALRDLYMGLGSKKWKEWVEEEWHLHGPLVFDFGLHQGCIEPGFSSGMERATRYLYYRLGKKTLDQAISELPDLLMNVHRLATGHFLGDLTQTLGGSSISGKFRDIAVEITLRRQTGPEASSLSEISKEFEALNQEAKQEVVTVEEMPSDKIRVNFKGISAPEIRRIYTELSESLRKDLQAAKDDPKAKLEALCRFHRKSVWLHPPTDGSSRTTTAVFNYLLVLLGFSPAIWKEFEIPVFCYSLPNLIQEVEASMKRWKEEVQKTS